MKLNSIICPEFAVIVYLPSKSVWVPDIGVRTPEACASNNAMLTPGRGIPSPSVTVPDTVLSYAKEICTTKANKSIKIPHNFVFICLICLN